MPPEHERTGEAYRPFPNLGHRNVLQRHVEVPAFAWSLRLPRGGRVLEVGCGRGAALPTLRKLLSPTLLVGVDIDPRILVEARGSDSGQSVLAGDVRDLPFASRSFDIVIDFGTCYHIDRPLLALGEIARVLCAGGAFATETKLAQLLAHPVRTRGRRLDPAQTGAFELQVHAGMWARYRRR